MNIEKYADYFHDGSIIDIKTKKNNLEIFMSSAEVSPNDIKGPIPLSSDCRIKGILKIKNVKKAEINKNNANINEIKMRSDFGTIFTFEIENQTVLLKIIWESSQPDRREQDFSTFEIEADKIDFEVIPDLADPFF